MLSTEAEALGKFAGSAVASPLVQLGTLVSVLGFIVTAQPWLGILALGVVLPQAVIVLAIFRSASTVRVKHAMLADALAERPGHGAAGAPAAAPT
jgi:hypothetical protein